MRDRADMSSWKDKAGAAIVILGAALIWYQHGDSISRWVSTFRETHEIVSEADRETARAEAETARIEALTAQSQADQNRRTNIALQATGMGQDPAFALALDSLSTMQIDAETRQICSDIVRGLAATHRPGQTLRQEDADAVMARVTRTHLQAISKIERCGEIVIELLDNPA